MCQVTTPITSQTPPTIFGGANRSATDVDNTNEYCGTTGHSVKM